MSGVVFVPMESLGNFDPVRVYEELILHYSTLKGRKITAMSCEVSNDNCSIVIPFISQIALPIISGVGQIVLIMLLPSPAQEINPIVNHDLANSMFRYLTESKTGRKFALDLGYNNVKKMTLDQFIFSGVAGISPIDWCYSTNGIYLNTQLDNVLFNLGGYSLLSSTIASILNTCTPFVINRLIPTEFPNGQFREAENLLDRTDHLMRKAARQLTAEQKSNLESNRKSLRRLKNRTRIVLGVSAAIFLADLGMKFYLVNLGLQQIDSKTNPQILYRQGLPDFCSFSQPKCNATLFPLNDDDKCRQPYPADFIDFAKENSSINSSQIDLGIWKVWTVVMLPLAGRILENIPLLYRTTKEAIQRCRWPKGRRASPLNALQEEL